MGYGNNKERRDWLMRAVPLGLGELTHHKRVQLHTLRTLVIELIRAMAIGAFVAEPLLNVGASAEEKKQANRALDDRLVEFQKSKEGLNAVWCEQGRMRVKPALEQCDKRYLRQLAGRLRFVGQKIPKSERTVSTPSADDGVPVEPQRTYFNVPAEVQDVVTEVELAALVKIAEEKQAIETFKRVIIDGDLTGFSENQLAILRFIHARAQEKHIPPEFGAQDNFTLQLHIDYRMLPTGRQAEAQELRNGVAFLLEDNKNKRYHRFLDLSGVAPRAERIRLPLVLTKKIARRLESTRPEWASLIVEIAETTVGVRLVAGKPAPVAAGELYRVIGRDFGYANTITLSVAESAVAIDLEKAKAEIAMLDDDQEASRAFIHGRELPQDVKILERLRFCGKAFLDRAATHCKQIDGLKSKIDLAYNRLNQLKQDIATALNLQIGDLITKEMKRSEQGENVREFFATFGLINDLKQARRAIYRKIGALKKNWFGLLSNIEIELARKFQAAVVRENLTVLTAEVDSPAYKGRTFNKMLNNGSKGQYQNRATDKFKWHGVPEIVIPSWYTSRACLLHSTIVEKKHRKGEKIFFPCCGKHDHADEHAADTIAQYVFLRPRLTGRTCAGL
jgi:transposase